MQRCPFYGFHQSENLNVFVYSKGNQCGLETPDFVPCLMEQEEGKINWDSCPMNNPRNHRELQTFLENSNVFTGASSNSIPFKEHYRKIMGSEED